MTDKARQILEHCRCEFYITETNDCELKVTPCPYAESKRIYAEIAKGMRKDELDEIKAHLIAEHNAQVSAEKIRQAKIDAIEGLKEIHAAIEAERRYFEGLDDDCPPEKPTADIYDIEAKYPRAAAYIKAEDFIDYSRDVKAKAVGAKALEKIINGEDYAAALADIKKEWEDYCMKRWEYYYADRIRD